MEKNDLDPHLAIEQSLAQLDMDDDSSDSQEEEERREEDVGPIGSGRETPSTENTYVPPVIVNECEGNYYPSPRQQHNTLPERPAHQQSEAEDEQIRLLKRVLEDEHVFRNFRQFVKDNCSSSNLNFWLACGQFRKTPPTERTRLRDSAKAIYQQYISSSGPQRVNLSQKTCQPIRVIIRLGSPPSTNVFDAAQQEVLELLAHNEFRKFLASDTMSEVSTGSPPESAITHSSYNHYIKYPRVPSAISSKASSTFDDRSSSYSVDSDPGPYSYMRPMHRRLPPHSVLSRPISTRGSTVSDTDARTGHSGRNMPSSGSKVRQPRIASQEEFVAQITERLLAVQKDRESMRRQVREMVFRRGGVTEEVDWYDHPAVRKFTATEDLANEVGLITELDQTIRSDVSDPPIPGPQTPSCTSNHLDVIAQQELKMAIEDLAIRKQHKQQVGSQSSVVTDSGIASDFVYPMEPSAMSSEARVQQYIRSQQKCTEMYSDRENAAIRAANMIVTNIPMTDNPPMPPSTYNYPDECSRRQSHDAVDQWMARNEGGMSSQRYSGMPASHNYPPPRGGDDSSSCFSSDLFVPHTARDSMNDSDFPKTLNRHARSSDQRRLGGTQRKSRQPLPVDLLTPRPGEKVVHVLYYMDNEKIPFTRKITDRDITLGEFKEHIFARKGNYRFFFLDWCEEIELEAHQEYINDSDILPRHKGRITGRIELV